MNVEIRKGRPRKYSSREEYEKTYYKLHKEEMIEKQRIRRRKKREVSKSPSVSPSNDSSINFESSDDGYINLLDFYESKIC
jgi:hypothetical protein